MDAYLNQKSKFHTYREKYQPRFPAVLKENNLQSTFEDAKVLPEIASIFPNIQQKGVRSINFKKGSDQEKIVGALRIGCVLSGGQAAGGHNVIIGIYDYIKKRHPNSQLFGFLDGPKGIFTGKYMELTNNIVNYFRNRGGFDMIRSGRDKIEKPQQFQKSLQYCQSLKLDGLVIIGGDDSNTNAALLAEYFLKMKSNIRVVGCPKTIDGDLKNQFVEVSFGFDTACKTYSECIGSLIADTLSSKKYYHFIRLMGRSASHIVLQCQLLTRANYAFIGEQVSAKNQTLKQLVQGLVDTIVKRSQLGRDYGIVLVPEGLIQFIPQVGRLIGQINKIMAKIENKNLEQIRSIVLQQLDQQSRQLFIFFPVEIANQLLLDRDPHGNVQVAKIQTQKFLINLVEKELQEKNFKGKFDPLANYFGYEGRCAFPTTFDCDYCYAIGLNAAAIIEAGQTGLMSCIRNLQKQPQEWIAGGYPLVTMMNIQHRKGKDVPVIKKALVQLQGPLFKIFEKQRGRWALEDCYNIMGPTQYQFPNIKPFLAVTPNESQIYWNKIEKKYSISSYAQILPIHMNDFTYSLSKEEVQYPSILNEQVSLIHSQTLIHNSRQLARAVQQQYSFLADKGQNTMLTFKKVLQENKQQRHLRIGISFNGRQFPGGHNILKGLLGQNVTLFGFLEGNKGLFNNKYIQVTNEVLQLYLNQSGYYLLGRNSDSLRHQQQLQKTMKTCQDLNLDGLILVGASHTMTDSLILTNYLLKNGVKTSIIGIPASIDNSVKHQNLEVSIGYATSSHVYSTLISNLMIDASSNTKYWYFIKLMGQDPSNLTLQCALATHPNYTIIGQEIQKKGWDIEELINDIARVVIKRANKKLNFGCVLVPEGLPYFLPTFKRLVAEMDEIKEEDQDKLVNKFSVWAKQRYLKLPDFIKKQLHYRDKSTKRLAFSQVETEKMLAFLLDKRLGQLKKQGKYTGSFSSVCHFFGYQGRCAVPSLFDRNLAASYGRIARILIEKNMTGYCPSIRGTSRDVNMWFPIAIPLIHLVTLKEKSSYGHNKPIVIPHFIDIQSTSFQHFVQRRKDWELFDHYESPGPIQHFGQMKNYIPLTLILQSNNDNEMIQQIQKNLNQLKSRCKFGSDTKQLQIIKQNLSALMHTLKLVERH